MSEALSVPSDRLDKIIRYMKAEDIVEAEPGEREIIEDLCLASRSYLLGAPLKETEENSRLYWFVVQAMTLHAYDHRDEVGFIPEGVRPIVNQLKLDEDYPASE